MMTKCQQLAKKKRKNPVWFEHAVRLIQESISKPEKSMYFILPPERRNE